MSRKISIFERKLIDILVSCRPYSLYHFMANVSDVLLCICLHLNRDVICVRYGLSSRRCHAEFLPIEPLGITIMKLRNFICIMHLKNVHNSSLFVNISWCRSKIFEIWFIVLKLCQASLTINLYYCYAENNERSMHCPLHNQKNTKLVTMIHHASIIRQLDKLNTQRWKRAVFWSNENAKTIRTCRKMFLIRFL